MTVLVVCGVWEALFAVVAWLDFCVRSNPEALMSVCAAVPRKVRRVCSRPIRHLVES